MKKSQWQAVYFLFIPLFIVLLVIPLKEAWGPYYIGYNSDPAYLYLVNGLDIAQLKFVHHVDNPGTTAQIISGITIKIISLFRGVEDLPKDVFLHSEFYLNAINTVMFGLCMIALIFVGVTVFQLTGNLWWGIFFQAVPFISWQLFRVFLKVSPEPVVFILTVVWTITLLKIALNESRELPFSYVVWFAFLIALSFATKLTFFPFLFIPFFILARKQWKWYLLMGIIFFHLLIIPAWKHYDYFIEWAARLFMHSDQYGNGPRTIVDIPQAMVNLLKLLALEHTFFIASLCGGAVLVFIYRNRNSNLGLWKSNETRTLLAVLTVVVLQMLMIAKHYNPHYMIPSLIFFPLIIFLSVRLSQKILKKKFRSDRFFTFE